MTQHVASSYNWMCHLATSGLYLKTMYSVLLIITAYIWNL